jgi:hypothetical protein
VSESNKRTLQLDGATRAAADRVGSELFRIQRARPSESTEIPRKKWLATLDDFRNYLISAA